MTTGDGHETAPPSFDDLYRDHFAYVWHSLRRLGTPANKLVDVAHDAFVSARSAIAKFDSGFDPRLWLFGFAMRAEGERVRREGSKRADEIPVAFDSEPSREDAERERLVRALRAIEPERRAVVILVDIDGFDVDSVARALGLSPRVIDSRLRIGREELAKAWGRGT